MEPIIRAATAEDYAPLCELFEALDALHREALPHIFQRGGGPPRDRQYFLSQLEDPGAGLFVAEVDGAIAGFVLGLVRETPPIPVFVPRRYVAVDSIAVQEGRRRAGIASAMMRQLEAWAAEIDAGAIERNVYEFNTAAIRFYEELGFETTSRRMSKAITRPRTEG